MSVTFEFRRHSIKDGPARGMIGPKGFALARAVGERQLRGRGFTHFFASALWRTHQTLAAFDEGAGDFRCQMTPIQAPIYLPWPELPDLWRYCSDAAKRGKDMLQAALEHDPALVTRAASEIAAMFHEWEMSDGSRVLIVGHSPNMELIPFGLLGGVTMPGLKECQGFQIIREGDRHEVDWQSPRLDPSAIRRDLFPDESK